MKKFIVKAYVDEENNIRIGLFDKKGNIVERSRTTYLDETPEQDKILLDAISKVSSILYTKYNGKVETNYQTPYYFKLQEESEKESAERIEKEEQEKKAFVNDLEVNEEYLEENKNKKMKLTTIGLIAGGVAIAVGLSSCSYALGKAKGKKEAEAASLANNPTLASASLEYAEEDLNSTILDSNIVESISTPTPTPAKVYTDEEKIDFIYANVDKFQAEFNEITGLEMDSNQALLQLAYINGLSQSQVGFDSNDYILDFLTDYGAYWDKMTTQTKNNIAINVIDIKTGERVSYEEIDFENLTEEEKTCYGKLFAPIPLKGENPFKNGELYANYILDNEDKIAYQELASQIENIVTYAYNGETQKAVEASYEVNKYAAERYVFDNNPDIDFNYQNLSESTKLMNRVMVAHITHFLPEETEFKVDTLVGEQTMINYDVDKEMASFDPDAVGYTVTNNLHYDNDYYYQWLTITETVKSIEDLEKCVVPEETPKTKTLSK